MDRPPTTDHPLDIIPVGFEHCCVGEKPPTAHRLPHVSAHLHTHLQRPGNSCLDGAAPPLELPGWIIRRPPLRMKRSWCMGGEYPQ